MWLDDGIEIMRRCKRQEKRQLRLRHGSIDPGVLLSKA